MPELGRKDSTGGQSFDGMSSFKNSIISKFSGIFGKPQTEIESRPS